MKDSTKTLLGIVVGAIVSFVVAKVADEVISAACPGCGKKAHKHGDVYVCNYCSFTFNK